VALGTRLSESWKGKEWFFGMVKDMTKAYTDNITNYHQNFKNKKKSISTPAYTKRRTTSTFSFKFELNLLSVFNAEFMFSLHSDKSVTNFEDQLTQDVYGVRKLALDCYRTTYRSLKDRRFDHFLRLRNIF
jgi:hypothetical protein